MNSHKRSLTTEQLMEEVIQAVQRMSPQEKAIVRMHLDGVFAESDREFLRAMGIAPAVLTDRLGVQLARTIPPIPEGCYRLRTSDGAIHDVPVENIELARAIDPDLVILNPFDFWN